MLFRSMGAPVFKAQLLPFDASGLQAAREQAADVWPVDVDGRQVYVSVVSMGNPHAVQFVDDVDTAPVAVQGPLVERHARFPRRVNAGFLQVIGPHAARLRVYERGAGETLACGTGACAAVVAGKTGVVLQNRSAYFSLDPKSPNRLEPGKTPLHTLIASMGKRNGKLWSVLGCMGADGQPQIQLQAYVAMMDFGCDIQQALETPRWLSGDRKSTRLNSSHPSRSRMPSSA